MTARFITAPVQSTTILEAYNAWRAKTYQLPPVQRHTLVRYCAGGQGYEKGLPKKFVEFLATLI